MASVRFLDAHRTWEDWVGIGLGIVIGFVPVLAGETASEAVMLTAMLIGLLIMVISGFEMVELHRWEEIGLLTCGLALIALPLIFGYAAAGALRFWHLGLGSLVCLLALFELWQDRRRTPRAVSEHDQ